jgi:hypothetical protein
MRARAGEGWEVNGALEGRGERMKREEGGHQFIVYHCKYIYSRQFKGRFRCQHFRTVQYLFAITNGLFHSFVFAPLFTSLQANL